ncbi:hypothetical protein WICPIJ_000629 [Wickerhamomyces pijperi]|uniref:Protein ZIP4 homolog n=1 Tax=Wickerhamomyces pijperi TaxID=599730 RepID=A0A9P8TSB0_WICPI|nr:hypothetical protein WICPIJ_000629 [Wickerhamomyces pijperi]
MDLSIPPVAKTSPVLLNLTERTDELCPSNRKVLSTCKYHAFVVNTAIATASKLNNALKDSDHDALKSSMETVLPMTERFERLLRTTEVDGLEGLSLELDFATINLWNSATVAMKGERDFIRKTLCSVKLFSCLLCSIHELLEPSLKGKLRVTNCLYKTLRDSIDEEEMVVANKVQTHSDRAFKDIEQLTETFDEKALTEFNKLKAELFITKMQLSVLEGDVQMAMFYEERADVLSNDRPGDDTILESLRIIYNTCLYLYEKKKFPDVIHFLSKYYDVGQYGSKSKESKNVRIYICGLLTRSALELNTTDSLKIAENCIQLMEQIDNTSMDCFKLAIRLSNLRPNESSNMSGSEEIIMRMIMTVPLIPNFKQIIGIINEHSRDNPSNAIKCLEYLFTNRIDPQEEHQYLELVFVAVVNCFVKDKINVANTRQSDLAKFLDVSERTFSRPLSKKCSSSSVTLLWASGKSEIKNGNFTDAIGWLQLTLHKSVLINEVDKAKVQRALQNCHINLCEYDQAIDIYEAMKPEEKMSLISQYNMFKIYTQKEDEPKILESLKNIAKNTGEKNMIPLLSLCALNTTSNTRVALETILILFKNLDATVGIDISIASTLRSVIQLLLKELPNKKEYIANLLTLFEEAYKFAKDCKYIKNYKFSIEELKWFSAQAFNVSRECLIAKDSLNGGFFADISRSLIDLIPDDISTEESFGLKLWKFRAELVKMMCVYQSTIAKDIIFNDLKTSAQRLKADIEEVLTVFKNHPNFIKFVKEIEKIFLDCLMFEIEANLNLGTYNTILSILKESFKYKNIDFDSTVVNLISKDSYPETLRVSIISTIIERNLLGGARTKISHWVRLLLKYCTVNLESEQITLSQLSKIIQMLSNESTNEENKFPKHEVEFISTTCWNIGVSKIFNNEKSQGEKWCLVAMNFAEFVNERFEIGLNEMWKELSNM